MGVVVDAGDMQDVNELVMRSGYGSVRGEPGGGGKGG